MSLSAEKIRFLKLEDIHGSADTLDAMNWAFRNWIFVAVSLGASLCFFWLYQKERWADSNLASLGRPIGTITESSDDVRRMPSGRLLWVPVGQQTQVFERDTIRTGPSARARIELGDSGQIEMQPDSLIVLDTRDDKIQVNLASGDLFLKGNVSARVDGRKIQSESGALQIMRRSEGELEIKADQESSIVIDGKTTQLTADSSLITNEEGEIALARYIVRLKAPLPASKLASEQLIDGRLSFLAEWTQIPDRETPNLMIQISKNRSFSSLARTQSISKMGDPISVELSSGLYYWRVVANSTEVLSPVSSFEILEPQTMRWSAASKPELSVRSDGIYADWSWSRPSKTENFNLVLYRGDKILFQVQDLRQSRLFWAAHTQAPFPDLLSESDYSTASYRIEIGSDSVAQKLVQKLKINDQRLPDPPSDLLASWVEMNRSLDMSWSTPLGLVIRSFEVRLGSKTHRLRSQQFSVPESDYRKSGSPKEFSVRAQSSSGAWSKWAVASIQNEEIGFGKTQLRAIHPLPGTRVVKKPQGNVFRWSRVRAQGIEPKSFEVKIDGPAYSKTHSSLGQNTDIELGRAGSYRWRVRPLWPNGEIGTWSDEFSFTLLPAPTLQAPRIRLPASSSY
jgi:hypothetical protein